MAGQTVRRRWPLLLALGSGAVVLVVVLLGSERTSPVSAPPGQEAEAPAGHLAPPPPVVAASTGPGPRSFAGAVPIGFARTPDGAAAAATSYLSTLHRLVVLVPAERETALRRISAPAADAVVSQAMDAMAALDAILVEARDAKPGARLFLREVPVAYEVEQFEPQRARVQCWSLGLVLVEGRTEATQVWSTNTVELVWEGDDWRLWSWSRLPGPVPATPYITATAPDEVLSAIEGWEGFSYVPSS